MNNTSPNPSLILRNEQMAGPWRTMRLTKHTEYALRILLFVGARESGYVSTEEISKAYGISNHHLVKIVNLLGKHDVLEVKRRRQGGVRLAKNAEDINLGAMVRLTEPGFQLAECFTDGEHDCPIDQVCTLIEPLQEALDAFLAVLDSKTLADMLREPHLHQIRQVFNRAKPS